MKTKKLSTSELWNGWHDAYKQLAHDKGKCRQVAISVEGCDDRTLFEWYVFDDELEFLKLMASRCNEVSKYQCQPEIHIYEDLESGEHYNEDKKIC